MSSKTKCWLWMLLVILSETSATSTLKMFGSSEGGSKMLLLGLLIALYCTCYYSLSRAVKDIPVGLAYATWSGTGILVVSTLGMAFYGQHPDTAAIIGMAVGTVSMAVVGIVGNALVMLPFYSNFMPLDTIIAAGAAINPAISNVWTFAVICVGPFNLIKGFVVSLITALVYKRISIIIHMSHPLGKKQVKEQA